MLLFLLQCEFFCTVYRVDVQDDLISQFNQAMLFLTKHLNIRSEIIGVNRYDICEIPIEALREAVVNAIMHRDYSISGTSLMVEVYVDRVCIVNPGGLIEGMDLQSLTRRSMRRNELIADIFSRIDKAERMGSGISRIMRLVADAGLPSPIIETNQFFEITFKRDPRFKVDNVNIEESLAFQRYVDLSARQVEIMQVLQGKKLATSEIMNLLTEKVVDRTIRRDLQLLRDKGYVDFEGSVGWDRKWFLTKK